MNPEQQHKAIVEACGWTAQKDSEGFWRAVDASGRMTFSRWISQENVWSAGFPAYLNDLNAMHEAVDTLNNDQQWQFIKHLNNITCDINHNDPDDWFTYSSYWIWRMVNATAAQRAEAFLRTIGKWKECK